MKCQENKQKIYSLIDNELSSHEERTLYGHLSSCSVCMTDYNHAREIDNLLQENIKHVEPPKDFADNVLKVITEENIISDEEHTEKESSKTAFKNNIFKNRWLGWAAGIALAVYLGISSFGLNVLQVADNKYTDFNNEPFLLEPQLSQSNNENNIPEQEENTNIQIASSEEETFEQQVSEDTSGLEVNNNNIVGEESNNNIKENINEENDQNLELNNNPDNNPAIASSNNGEKNQNISEPEATVETKDNTNTENNDPSDLTGSFQLAWDVNYTSTVISEKVEIDSIDDVLQPTWTKDGQDIIFAEKNENEYTWYKLRYEDNELNKLVGPMAAAGKWSTETKKILFTSPDSNGYDCIWTIGSNGGVKNVTPMEKDNIDIGLEKRRWAFDPVWSVKGEIAYLTERFGDIDIMITNSDGVNRRLTSTRESEKYPAWSPDGSKVAYYRYWNNKQTGEQMGQIVIQDSSGKNIKAVTPAVKSQSMVPTWSPDGSLLAINVTGDKCGIWKAGIENNDWEKMSVQGGGSVISWSPDGRNIVFNDLKNKMYVLRYDVGSRESKLIVVQHTETLSQDFDISWSPDGSRLLYEVKNLENNKNELWIAKLPKLVSDY